MYIGEAGKFESPMTRDEYRQFFLYTNGVKSVRWEIIRDNMAMVVKIALRYRDTKVHRFSLLELIDAGSEGLKDSIDHYTLGSHVRFSEFAAIYVRNSIVQKIGFDSYSTEVEV